MRNRFRSNLYTQGKFGPQLRQTLDTDNPYLYAYGQWPTKITADMLPVDYLGIRSRSIWYMQGYIRTSGVVDMKYRWSKWNHLFKDDYLYISYKDLIISYIDDFGLPDFKDYDIKICGYDIIPIILAVEKNSGFDSTELRKEIEIKRQYYRDNYPENYAREVGEDIDLFDWWRKHDY